ncbi:acyl-CoA dehydrogenase family protein [Tengunoibacter tsumagoiensis]|uniref:Putative acyl-CoA dehydrogenase YdbM n=1 Tax=Tengunoibacter tsumagoiensis TaxID=2014871 RepID=A0A402A397_9CHLR|nr:acyl-CoA dehydrogenase family protein [Tengunoibacter tsumagoiensis]GCE13614.1 putative acyl-CoA dehydrogenase YdbM [Tengunoibacter tsumagoiensis]
MSFLSYPETEQQKKWIAIAGELADLFAERAAKYDWEGRFPLENFEDLRRSGYTTLTVPQSLGGQGASLLDVLLAHFRLSQGDGSTGLVTCMHLIHVARLFEARTEYPPLLRKIAQDVVENGALINSAVSEPATGSPSRGGKPQTTAYRQPDGSWRVQGRKSFTTGSHALQYFIVGCSIEDQADGASGLEPLKADKGNFLIAHDAPGVSIEDTWDTLGMRGTGSNDLILDNVCLEADAYVDEQIPPMADAQGRLPAWTLLISVVYLGIAQAARDEAIRFATQRRPNSLKAPISSVPHIQEKVARMDLALLQSKAFLFSLAEQFQADPDSVQPALYGAAKYLVTNHAVEIVDLAMRVVGAASLALKSPLQRYYRDVRAGLHNPPMDDAALSQLAKLALEAPQTRS